MVKISQRALDQILFTDVRITHDLEQYKYSFEHMKNKIKVKAQARHVVFVIYCLTVYGRLRTMYSLAGLNKLILV